MSFMFQCPNGHVLEGDPAHAGQQCQCPTCGILFIIPPPPAPSPSAASGWTPQFGPRENAPAPFQVGGHPGAEAPSFTSPAPAEPEPEKLYHIPCPNGHELETPADMLGQDVLCPHCNVQFRLREKDSVEYKRQRREESIRRERKLGNVWLNWAITIAVVVVLGLLILILSGTRD
ncbi:MAG: hypothetical protein KDA71_14330 [Planctomycetales bacterium]|nr:hypothetical protein [Planctomycetales bacterium]